MNLKDASEAGTFVPEIEPGFSPKSEPWQVPVLDAEDSPSHSPSPR